MKNNNKKNSTELFTDNILMQNSVGGTPKRRWDEPQ